ncbi:preprotein translocase subunit SecG [Lactococcus lactis subsp. lactis]|uniref:preprotein translocase subunit SecG n=1 Tax=Lactococcus lactis TaxID=1358 RepID=UPI0035C9DE39|nr:preprotein translocase subunit SecG [Lactococcus lactis subsp. lactis]
MYSILIYLFIVISFMIILFILLQPSKQQDSMSLLSTDKSNILFESQKLRGVIYLLRCITASLGIIWIVLGITLMCFLGN